MLTPAARPSLGIGGPIVSARCRGCAGWKPEARCSFASKGTVEARGWLIGRTVGEDRGPCIRGKDPPNAGPVMTAILWDFDANDARSPAIERDLERGRETHCRAVKQAAILRQEFFAHGPDEYSSPVLTKRLVRAPHLAAATREAPMRREIRVERIRFDAYTIDRERLVDRTRTLIFLASCAREQDREGKQARQIGRNARASVIDQASGPGSVMVRTY